MGEEGIHLASGLARHLPRGVSNVAQTNNELIKNMKKAWTEGNGMLMPIFEAYFKSETYSCKSRPL